MQFINKEIPKYLEKKSKSSKKLVLIPIILLVLLFLIGLGYFVKNYFDLQSYKQDRDISALKDQIAKHIILPSGDPLVASVTDADKLKAEQPFYKNALNGDKVFIWQDKALIYRPSIDKIVDFGIIINNQQNQTGLTNQNTTTTSTPVSPSLSKAIVSLENGTKGAAAINSVLNTLKQNTSIQSLSTIQDLNLSAKSSDYSTSLVIDLSGKNSSLAQSIATAINGTVSDFPINETKPNNTDILVIAGQKSVK